MRKASLLTKVFTISALIISGFWFTNQTVSAEGANTNGALHAFNEKGETLGLSPLKHTDVKAEISGFLARVNVRQEFENNFGQPIEAVYTFPLSQNAAVDDMTMRIGSRVIKGKIMRREEAREVYETAKSQGQTAALLDQERPNIFTQQVANILPGEKIIIEISYVETLKYEDGEYEFVFPMVVGERYSPQSVKAEDAAKVSPPIAKTRAGHDISIEVNLDAGVPVENISSKLHEVNTLNLSSNSANIKLKNEKTIPNKDFILKYDVTGKRIEDAVLTHRGQNGGFFTMILQPPDQFKVEDITPKEIVFVLDTSGSMSGFPIEKAKEAMKLSLAGLHPRDTFNLITFAGSTSVLFDKPVPATRANLDYAEAFLSSRAGGGGTEMMKAIKASLEPSDSKEHLRIVCFMTDGYVSNEGEILSEIQKHPNARIFSFGIGNSVNRHLLDKMAEAGNGEVEYVSLQDDGSKAAKKFYERVRTPLLTDLSIDWNGMPVADVYPNKLSDLFSAKPVILNGRFTNAANGTIKLKGKVGGQFYEREIAVDFPETQSSHDVLATLWARKKVDELTKQDYKGVQNRDGDKSIAEQITNLGLEFRLLTPFTSFVAVEERPVNPNGQPMKVEVPVENADGVSKENKEISKVYKNWNSGDVAYIIKKSGGGQGSGIGSGIGRGSGTGSGSVAGNAQTVVVSSSDSTIGNSFVPQQIKSLPTNLRNVSSLLKISPNVRAEGYSGGFQIDGASGAENVFVIDGQEIANFRTGTLNTNNNMPGQPATGSITKLPKPEIPQDAEWSEADSTVNVEIWVDETGNVKRAKAVSGNAALQKTAELAASNSKFELPKFSGESLQMSGVIVYKFVDKENVTVSFDKLRVKLTPEAKRRLLMKEKMHFWIYDLVERLEKGETKQTLNEAEFVLGEKAEIQIVLKENSPQAIKQIKSLGFKVKEQKDTKIIGKINVKDLSKLVEVEQIEYILP